MTREKEDFIINICNKLNYAEISFDTQIIDFNHFIPIYKMFNDDFELNGDSIIIEDSFKEFKDNFLFELVDTHLLDKIKQHYKKFFIELYYKYERERMII